MAVKVTLVLCGLALAIQTAFAQYLGNSVVENNVVVNSGGNGLGIAGGYGGAIGLNNGLGCGAAGLGIAGASALGLGLNNGLGAGIGLGNVGGPGFIDLVSVSGGGVLPISSSSPIAPAGLNVLSNNAIDGNLLVSGQLPFLSAVAFEGTLASAGSGTASCGCGNGNIGITGETGSAGLCGRSGINGARGLYL